MATRVARGLLGAVGYGHDLQPVFVVEQALKPAANEFLAIGEDDRDLPGAVSRCSRGPLRAACVLVLFLSDAEKLRRGYGIR